MAGDLFSQIETSTPAPKLAPGTFLSPQMRDGRDGLRKAWGDKLYREKVAPYVQIIEQHRAQHPGTPFEAVNQILYEAREAGRVYSIGQQMLLRAAAVEIVEPITPAGSGTPAASCHNP